jgi:protein-S-isoprenylcysteine O-methyltransferase Ste14
MDAYAICGYMWVAWMLIWMAWALQSKQTQHRESFASQMSYALVLWLAIYFIFFAKNLGYWWHSDVFAYRPWIGCTGVAIAVLGFDITFWARFTLGGNWSSSVTVKVKHELIRSGPYRWVRHPIYSGMILAMAGTAIARDQWRGVVALVLMWVAFTIKRLKEEQFMRQTFGAQYTEYSDSTGAIFPLLLRR